MINLLWVDRTMFGKSEIKLFLVSLGIVLFLPLLFLPPKVWGAFTDYLFSNPLITTIGKSAYILAAAIVLTLVFIILKWVKNY